MFYPRYMEMFNALVEDWFRDELHVLWRDPRATRVGAARPSTWRSISWLPSTLGEILSSSLVVRRVGTTSIELDIELRGPDGGDRVRATSVLVLIDAKSRRAVAIPDDLRARIAEFCHPG